MASSFTLDTRALMAGCMMGLGAAHMLYWVERLRKEQSAALPAATSSPTDKPKMTDGIDLKARDKIVMPLPPPNPTPSPRTELPDRRSSIGNVIDNSNTSAIFVNTPPSPRRKKDSKTYSTPPPSPQRRAHHDAPIVIGVCGGSGSGKTTIAEAIMERAGIAQGDQIALIAHDSYYRDLGHIPDKEERAKVNFDHPDSLETELMIEHLQKLKNGEEVDVPVYSFDSHSRVSETTHISSGKRIIIVEGILIFSNLELVDMFDIKIFVDTADDIRFIRRLRRDIIDRERSITSVIDQYLNTIDLLF